MIDSTFVPRLYVYHERGEPQPLLPIDYGPFKEVALPTGIGGAPLYRQLDVARRTVQRFVRSTLQKPFGDVIGYEFEWKPNVSIFLNNAGHFDADIAEKNRQSSHDTLVPGAPNHFVIGHQRDGFCSLVTDVAGQIADDQDLFYAKRFRSLAEAQREADQLGASVFEVIRKGREETLRELTVDIQLAEAMPFPGCYVVTNQLLAGPSLFAGPVTEVEQRVRLIVGGGVDSVISLIEPNQLPLLKRSVDLVGEAALPKENLQQNFFPVPNLEAPSIRQMKIILDVIDAAVLEQRLVYVHCWGGRGRTGAVIGCWLRRHGVADSDTVLDEIAKLRFRCGVFRPSPESESQRHAIRTWREGD